MSADLAVLRDVDTAVAPANAQETMRLMQQFHTQGTEANQCQEYRGIAYGPDERNVLNVFSGSANAAAGEGSPVLVFIHGGNFVAGHCEVPGTPFFDNIGRWAVRQGWVGVNLTYRLAPETIYPGGTDDVADALEWILDHVGEYGGNPQQVIAVGTSAGGIHLALALNRRARLSKLAAAGFVSCLYDLESVTRDSPTGQYFPQDTDLAAISPLATLEASTMPLLLTVAEHDPAEYQTQYEHATAQLLQARPDSVICQRLVDHNHFSAVLELGLAEASLADLFHKLVAEAQTVHISESNRAIHS